MESWIQPSLDRLLRLTIFQFLQISQNLQLEGLKGWANPPTQDWILAEPLQVEENCLGAQQHLGFCPLPGKSLTPHLEMCTSPLSKWTQGRAGCSLPHPLSKGHESLPHSRLASPAPNISEGSQIVKIGYCYKLCTAKKATSNWLDLNTKTAK